MVARSGHAISATLVAGFALCALPRTSFADDAAPTSAAAAPAAASDPAVAAPVADAPIAATPVAPAPVAPDAVPPSPDTVTSRDASRSRAIDRTWLYLDDARTPAPWQVVGTTSVAYTTVGSNPDRAAAPYRAFAFNTAQPGALVSLGAEVGLLSWLSIEALGQIDAGGATGNANPGAIVDMRARLTPESWRNVRIAASAGYVRETWAGPVRDDDTGKLIPGQPHGDNGAWAQAAITADIQRLRLGLTAHGEHVFADGRDGVDVMLKAGINYRIVDWLRAGVEYVGQDLEESFKDGAEGGARHFVGPTAAVQLLQDRLTIVAGPSLGLSSASPQFLGRLALAYGF
jgi:hypothetical protein